MCFFSPQRMLSEPLRIDKIHVPTATDRTLNDCDTFSLLLATRYYGAKMFAGDDLNVYFARGSRNSDVLRFISKGQKSSTPP